MTITPTTPTPLEKAFAEKAEMIRQMGMRAEVLVSGDGEHQRRLADLLKSAAHILKSIPNTYSERLLETMSSSLLHFDTEDFKPDEDLREHFLQEMHSIHMHLK